MMEDYEDFGGWWTRGEGSGNLYGYWFGNGTGYGTDSGYANGGGKSNEQIYTRLIDRPGEGGSTSPRSFRYRNLERE
jgi:hypothetical protein